MSPILDDLSDLPAGDEIEGAPPVRQPVIVNKLIDAFYRQYLEDGEDQKDMAIDGARWRASWSSMCARQVGYNVMQADAKRALAGFVAEHGTDDPSGELDRLSEAVVVAEPSNPLTVSDFWRFNLGTMVHEVVQRVALEAFPGAEVEVKVGIDEFGGAHADLVIDELRYAEVETGDEGVQGDAVPYRTVCEIKSVGGFGFKLMTTSMKGPPEGPRRSAVVQGAVAAEALGADRLIIALLAMENLSPDVAERNGRDELGRFSAEFHYAPAEFLPLAEAERKRVRKILEIVDEGSLPPRHMPEIPSGARVTDPMTGAWTVVNDDGQIVRAGKFWGCKSYCSYRDRCQNDGPS